MAAGIVTEAGYSIVAQKVYIRTTFGLRILDIIAKDSSGQIVGFEVKTGLTARRSIDQLQKI